MLSTCNRTEVYAVAERFHGAYHDVRNFLAEPPYLAPEDFADHLYVHYDGEADPPPLHGRRRARLRRARREPRSSARSKQAWARAKDEGASGPPQPAVPPRPRGRQAGPHRHRHRPRHRLGVARRGRDGRRPTRLARRRAGCSCSAPATWARAWPSRWPAPASAEVQVANRTWDRAAALADRVGGRGRAPVRPARRAGRGRRAAHLHRRHRRSCSSTPTSRRSSRPATAGRC